MLVIPASHRPPCPATPLPAPPAHPTTTAWLQAAEAGDLARVRRVLDALTRPFDEAADEDDERYGYPAGTIEGRCLS